MAVEALYKLSPRANCDKWTLCALCQKGGETVWIPRSDGSTTRMKKHLIDVHNMYVGGFMHLMHAFVAHPCMRNDGCIYCVTVKSPRSIGTRARNKIIIHVFIKYTCYSKYYLSNAQASGSSVTV